MRLMKTFEEFALDKYPELKSMYETYLIPIEQLIGKKVVAIRSGFSCGSNGGTEMIVDEIYNSIFIRLKPTPGSFQEEQGTRGWSCAIEDIPFSIKLVE